MSIAHLPGLPEPRDLDLERRITAHAASILHLDTVLVGEFSAYAEQRAGHAPVRDLPTRDFKTETLEELADARNYLVWWSIQAGEHGDEVTLEVIQHVLAHIIHCAVLLLGVPATRSIHEPRESEGS